MHYHTYTRKEKLAHLERAKTVREEGKGSFMSYAKNAGIGRSTFYKWMHTYGYYEEDYDPKPIIPFVGLGKPLEKQPAGDQKMVVHVFGAKIEVSLPGSFLELLQGIRIESSI